VNPHSAESQLPIHTCALLSLPFQSVSKINKTFVKGDSFGEKIAMNSNFGKEERMA
jgi:hypothetical protein